MPPTKLLESPRVEKLASLFLIVVTILMALVAIDRVAGLFEPRPTMGNTITVDGEGKITVVPDIATVSFSVTEDATTASQAQDAAAKKINVALAVAKQQGVAEKDIKTTSYSISPKYNTPQPCYAGYCPSYDQRVIGYTSSQTVEVKVRKIDDVGKVLSSLGDAGVSNLYGPNFTVDNIDKVREQAREAAIADARAKAKVLAKDLGVSIVRVASFYENGVPVYYYGKGGAAMDSVSAAPAAAPQIPAGENEITINVSVSYEIR